jgi:hypothetical protein
MRRRTSRGARSPRFHRRICPCRSPSRADGTTVALTPPGSENPRRGPEGQRSARCSPFQLRNRPRPPKRWVGHPSCAARISRGCDASVEHLAGTLSRFSGARRPSRQATTTSPGRAAATTSGLSQGGLSSGSPPASKREDARPCAGARCVVGSRVFADQGRKGQLLVSPVRGDLLGRHAVSFTVQERDPSAQRRRDNALARRRRAAGRDAFAPGGRRRGAKRAHRCLRNRTEHRSGES